MCRRGMRELDVLLQSFVERESASLGANAWPEFEELLNCEDDCIWDWLQVPVSPDAQRFRALLIEIRRATATLD